VIYLSFLEIYAEEIIDLLVKGKAQVRVLRRLLSENRHGIGTIFIMCLWDSLLE
jgi:hypothetical protein